MQFRNVFKICLALVVCSLVSSLAYAAADPFSTDEHTVALWHLDGDGTDSSGNDYHLSVDSGDVSWETGLFNSAVRLGSNTWGTESLAAPGGPGCVYSGTGDWTVDAWINVEPELLVYDAFEIVHHYSEHVAGHDPFIFDYYKSTNSLFVQFNNNYTIDVSLSPIYSGSGWLHVAMQYRYMESLQLFAGYDSVLGVDDFLGELEVPVVMEYLPSYNITVGGNAMQTSTGGMIDEVRLSDTARYVPEPALLLLLGLGGLGLLCRKRSKA